MIIARKGARMILKIFLKMLSPFCLTVTVQSAFTPFEAVAVIVAVPSETAVTTPFSSTVATDVSDELQVTDLSVASLGLTVAVRVNVSPMLRDFLLLLSLTLVTATGSSLLMARVSSAPHFEQTRFSSPSESTVGAVTVCHELHLWVQGFQLKCIVALVRQLLSSPIVIFSHCASVPQ